MSRCLSVLRDIIYPYMLHIFPTSRHATEDFMCRLIKEHMQKPSILLATDVRCSYMLVLVIDELTMNRREVINRTVRVRVAQRVHFSLQCENPSVQCNCFFV